MADRKGRPKARGRCPECGRVISGKPVGPAHVALAPHNRSATARRKETCLSLAGWRKVDRLPDDTPG